VTITIENFSANVIVDGGAELEQSLRLALDDDTGVAKAFRTIVDSNDEGDAHVVLATVDGVKRASTFATGLHQDRLWLDIGCVSKLLTAMTFQRTFSKDPSILKAPVSKMLGVDGTAELSQVCIQDLLNHTHGLDIPIGMELPLLQSGHIDVVSIIAAAKDKFVTRPGDRSYSYSNAGAWLLAAILENTQQVLFVKVVRAKFPDLLQPKLGSDVFCPATGRGAHVDAERLLLALVSATAINRQLDERIFTLGPANTIPYPGWHALENGVCFGWKQYANGWYGHQGNFTRTPLIVRVHPAEGIGVIVSSRSVPPLRLFQKLFSDDFVGKPFRPSLMTHQNANRGGRVRYAGIYERNGSRMEVCVAESGFTLDFTIRKVHESCQQTTLNSKLQPLVPGIFKVAWSRDPSDRADTPVIAEFGFVEFIYDTNGLVSHLWNGWLLWRKTG
jgi:hypothetical protein